MTAKTTLSSRGQVVLPQKIRNALHINAGDKMKCVVEGDSIILTPETPRVREPKFVTDALTGLTVVKARKDSTPVSTEYIQEFIDADFP